MTKQLAAEVLRENVRWLLDSEWLSQREAAEEIGVRRPHNVPVASLGPGEVGFITAGIKSVADCRIGDTLTEGETIKIVGESMDLILENRIFRDRMDGVAVVTPEMAMSLMPARSSPNTTRRCTVDVEL